MKRFLVFFFLTACGPDLATTGPGGHSGGSGGSSGSTGGSGGHSGGTAMSGTGGGSGSNGGGADQTGCEGQPTGCYTVYAHSDYTLYSIDLMTKALTLVGPFNAPGNDVITDLAVSPSGEIWVVSHTTLYTADPSNGHVTKIATLSDCGQDNVALTFLPDARMFVADYKGQFCRIDYTASPPTVTPIAKLGNNMAVSGDLVAVKDGTLYASAYNLSDPSGSGTQMNNVLVKLNPDTAAVTMVGASGFPKLFGIAFAMGKVFGFTHDGSGRVVTIDPQTGAGTLFNTFSDPMTGQKISFAGAGVNSLVDPTIN
jgi:hypothetical protein